MESMKKFAFERPVIFSVLAMALSIGITFIPCNVFLRSILNEQAAEQVCIK